MSRGFDVKRALVFTATSPGLRLCDADPALTERVDPDTLTPPASRTQFLEHPNPRRFPL